VVVIDGDLAAAAVFQALYSPAVIRYLPLIVRVLETRRDDVLEPLMGSISGAQASSRGLFLSVECYERAPYLAEEAVTEDATNAPGLAAHGTLIRPYLGDCGAWLAERASPAELDAVRSDIPTLVLSGSLDPITPPAWGKLAASTLANSFFVEARTGSHGSSTDECSRSIIRDFLYSPSVAPNTACNDRRPPLRFATGVRLNGGIYRTATALRRAPTGSAIWWIGATVVVLLSSAMTWPLSLLARRRRQREPPWAHAAITARWLALLAMVAAIGFLAGLVGIALRTVRTAPLTLAFGVPDAAAPLFVLPWAVAIIGAVLMMLTAAAWIQKAWTRAARIHYMLIALACLSLVAFLAHYRLI
jgi:uncharacterized membrane protein YhaH (DUF805 family)